MKKIFLLLLIPLFLQGFIEKGTGDNHVLLLHGFCANTFTWRDQLETLSSAGYHVWAIDLAGFGKSCKNAESYSLALYEKQILTFMKQHRIPSSHIVAHSMGGFIALAFTQNHPSSVRSLLLLAPVAYPIKLPTILAKCPSPLLYLLITETTLRLALKRIFYNNDCITDQRIEAYWAPFQTPGAKEAAIKVLGLFDSLKGRSYKNIKKPTFLIWGDKDKIIPLEQFILLQKELACSEVMVIANCGHAPQEECPHAVNKGLVSFLKRLS